MWEYETNPGRWLLVTAEWRATVERVRTPRYHWLPHIERIIEPYDRYDGPTSNDPIQGRTWCLLKMTELRD